MKEQILQYLMLHADGYVSGAELATELQVSRNTIWKTIQQLKDAGYQIESQHRVGYRYRGGNVLNATTIKQGLQTDIAVQVFNTIDSTNKFAKNLAVTAPTKPVAIIANEQTAGYGRQGRAYYSPADDGLYLSLLLPMHDERLNSGLLTTGVATAVADTLAKLYHVQPQIKWVNDVIVNQHKVVGIMTEGIADLESGTLSHVIIGIGLNLTNVEFPTELSQKVGSLGLADVDRNQLATQLLNALLTLVTTYQTATFMARYRELSLVIGQEVTLSRYGTEISGRVTDIADDGALILNTKDGAQSFTSGEITKVNILNGEYHG
ncbi:biotin--[acetyl-CoA-carboxylase] ligase [Periweissella cryptocerci]|uniref:Bifunctional ligase/repressor BirA n=1 Tax=Periweissella cryptocerci TaxID=2506420 RepID=A0A4V1AIS3_9LACO|nr:biotin--[acetyl-CoA-carboxylase] ligase [Periweissella cryptocerci]QBO36505.1 biotin--[acetyl-CoA-carboxylase] ligase [Periweissella cryptocerci]